MTEAIGEIILGSVIIVIMDMMKEVQTGREGIVHMEGMSDPNLDPGPGHGHALVPGLVDMMIM